MRTWASRWRWNQPSSSTRTSSESASAQTCGLGGEMIECQIIVILMHSNDSIDLVQATMQKAFRKYYRIATTLQDFQAPWWPPNSGRIAYARSESRPMKPGHALYKLCYSVSLVVTANVDWIGFYDWQDIQYVKWWVRNCNAGSCTRAQLCNVDETLARSGSVQQHVAENIQWLYRFRNLARSFPMYEWYLYRYCNLLYSELKARVMCGNESRAGRGVVCATPKKVVLINTPPTFATTH